MEVRSLESSTEPRFRPSIAFQSPKLPYRQDRVALDILSCIGISAIHRTKRIYCCLEHSVFLALSLIPSVSALDNGAIFTPIYNSTPDIQASIDSESRWFYLNGWDERGMLIRAGSTNMECLGNLSWALDNLSTLSAAEYSGANGAMTLLPTVASLLGASSEEMWELYKLMPLAGVLTMFLSLGGTINPNAEINNQSKAKMRKRFDVDDRNGIYQGIPDQDPQSYIDDELVNQFAEKVKHRAGSKGALDKTRHWVIWVGLSIQAVGIAAVLLVLWFGQLGAVIPWWCMCWGWMWFWYFLVTVVSMIENATLAPFTYSYTMRISSGPGRQQVLREGGQQNQQHMDERMHIKDILKSQPEPITITDWSPCDSVKSFYVIVSQSEKETWHEALAVASKLSSVIVYAFGTMVFSSATLMSISTALMVLTVVLCSGVVGRAIAMWMTRELHDKNAPSIMREHASGPRGLSSLVLAILDIDGLVVEIGGNVFVNGILIRKKKRMLCWSTYVGLLAKPFDLMDDYVLKC